jgi:hypothetical protein
VNANWEVKILRSLIWFTSSAESQRSRATLKFSLNSLESLCLFMYANLIHKHTLPFVCMSNTFSDKEQLSTRMGDMVQRKDSPLAFRIPRELKEELQKIAERELRSLSQICEVFLKISADQYRKEGPRFFERFFENKKSAQ